MNRRKYITITGGLTFGSASIINFLKRPVIASDIVINDVNIPKNWGEPTIHINFSTFKIITNNINENIEITLLAKFREEDNFTEVNSFSTYIEKNEINISNDDMPPFNISNSINFDAKLDNKVVGDSITVDTKIKINHSGITTVTDISEFDIIITDPIIPDSGKLLEGFNTGTLSSNYGGVINSSSIQSNRVFSGDYSLEINDAKGEGIARTDIEISRGKRYSGWVQAESGGSNYRAGMYWMAQESQSNPNGYWARVSVTENRFVIYVQKNNTGFTEIASDSLPLSGDKWYNIEFEPNIDNTENWNLFENDNGKRGPKISELTTSDGSYSTGGFGFRMGHGTDSAFFGDVRQWE